MKHALPMLLLALPLALTTPALAQVQPDAPYTPPQADSGTGTPDGGEEPADALGGFLEQEFGDLFTKIQPHMEAIGKDLAGKLIELKPVFEDLAEQIDDIRNYQAPIRLPNGDILIRRKEGAPPPPEGKNLPDLKAPNGDKGTAPGTAPSDKGILLEEMQPRPEIEL